MSYCAHNKEPVPDWKNLGFVQLKPFLKHLASQNHIHFVGDHLVHPDNEGAEVDIVGYDEEEASDDTEPVLNRSTSSGILTHAKAISSPKLKKSGSFSTGNDGSKLVGCPICQKMVAEGEVNRHLDECLNLQLLNNEQQNGGNNAANNGAVPNNNNPRLERAAAVALQDDEEDAAPATRLRLGHRYVKALNRRQGGGSNMCCAAGAWANEGGLAGSGSLLQINAHDSLPWRKKKTRKTSTMKRRKKKKKKKRTRS
jgi:hypothetical protein